MLDGPKSAKSGSGVNGCGRRRLNVVPSLGSDMILAAVKITELNSNSKIIYKKNQFCNV